jgi:isopentenyl-diphosphate delta-isomerase
MTSLGDAANRPADMLILVDADDRELGFCSKEECHRGEGMLHRAFSVFIFNSRGAVLLQQRSALKPLWPLFWSNSCCSHPRRGETVEAAARRRVREELAIDCELRFLYKFEYHARFNTQGSERELCSVLAAISDDVPAPDPAEIAAWRYLAPAELSAEIAREPERFTPWLKLEWAEIIARHLPAILASLPIRARSAVRGH